MRIALVHDFIYTWGGAEQVLKELHAIFPEAPIYTLCADPSLVAQHLLAAEVRTSTLQRSVMRRSARALKGLAPRAIEEFDFSDYDVVLSSSGAFSHGIITGPNTKHLCYCHSPMRYAWDWHAENARAWAGNALLRPIYSTWIHRLRTWDQVSAARVDSWIANSATVAARIKKYYGADATVCFPPVAIDRYTPGDAQRGRSVYTVGRLNRPKRLDILVRACALANLELRIAGKGPEEDALRKLAHEVGAHVTFLGRVSDQENLNELRSCGVFGFAAEEDFGITPVEAQACGAPVVAYGYGGASETIQEGITGILVPSTSPEAFADALTRALETSWDTDAIRSNAERFSRERFATQIQELVNHAL